MKVLKGFTSRSYVIRTQDGLIRRNQTHITLAEHLQPSDHQTLEKNKAQIGVSSVAVKSSEATKSKSISEGETPTESPQMKTSSWMQTSRYGRIRRPPVRLDL